MSKVVTIHGHTLELDMGPSCPNPGIRRQLDAKILELAETEEELLDYLKDVSEFTRDEKGNN